LLSSRLGALEEQEGKVGAKVRIRKALRPIRKKLPSVGLASWSKTRNQAVYDVDRGEDIINSIKDNSK
jgi:hypothetical protein